VTAANRSRREGLRCAKLAGSIEATSHSLFVALKMSALNLASACPTRVGAGFSLYGVRRGSGRRAVLRAVFGAARRHSLIDQPIWAGQPIEFGVGTDGDLGTVYDDPVARKRREGP